MTKGGMQSQATHSNHCKICGYTAFIIYPDGIRGTNAQYIAKHWTKGGNVVWCDNVGNKRKKNVYNFND